MDCRVSYEHSPASAPEDFIVKVPSQLVEGVPTNIPRARRPEFISDLIRKRSVHIGKIRKDPQIAALVIVQAICSVRIPNAAIVPRRRLGMKRPHL
jgi:hypothetical protein